MTGKTLTLYTHNFIWAGNPQRKLAAQTATNLLPPTYEPATNAGSSNSGYLSILAVIVPVVMIAVACLGCAAYCLIRTR